MKSIHAIMVFIMVVVLGTRIANAGWLDKLNELKDSAAQVEKVIDIITDKVEPEKSEKKDAEQHGADKQGSQQLNKKHGGQVSTLSENKEQYLHFPDIGNTIALLKIGSNYNPSTRIIVEYSEACAEKMSLSVRIFSKETKRHFLPTIKELIHKARPIVQQRCKQVRYIAVEAFRQSPKDRSDIYLGELSSKDDWVLNDIAFDYKYPFATRSLDSNGVLVGRSALKNLRFIVSETGEVKGRYATSLGLSGRLKGKAIANLGLKGRVNYYITDGYFYEYGSANKKCAEEKNGYAYWGSFQLKVYNARKGKSSKSRGVLNACKESNSGGRSQKFVFRFKESNPFNKINHKLLANNNDHVFIVAQGNKWKAEINDKHWCLNGAKIKVTYDVPHGQRNSVLSNKTYSPSYHDITHKLQKILLKKCPTLTSITTINYQKGDSEYWDKMLYTVNPKRPDLLAFLQRIAGGYLDMVYNNQCSGCHGTGAGGAPIVGDNSTWSNQLMPVVNASRDLVFHFNHMHCPDCTQQHLEQLYKTMRYGNKYRKLTKLDSRQKQFADYANNPSPKSLIKSGLLRFNKTILDIYNGELKEITDKEKLKRLFRDYITIYDHKCNKYLPTNAATYTFTYESTEYTVDDGIMDVETTKNEGATVMMEPLFYPLFKSSPGGVSDYAIANFDSPLNPVAISLPDAFTPEIRQRWVNKAYRVMDRTADTRALLAKTEYCTDSAVKQYIDNLFDYLR